MQIIKSSIYFSITKYLEGDRNAKNQTRYGYWS